MTDAKNNPLIEKEKEIQKSWEDNKIFEKSLAATRNGEVFSFYDGPPFATGTPHYGHFPSSFIKDVVPRYQTMKGKYVERRWGWDCHGLPIENLIEQELDLKSRKDIEAMGISKFNNSCRLSVLRYADIWKKTIPRLGRWVDMEADYKTMEPWYMESIWWVFKQLFDKGLIYEGYKSMHICPRCETTLSNFEVTQGYRDVKDLAVTAKFELQDEPGTYVLAWTTTPWTLIGNVALAVGEDIDYVKVIYKDTKTQNHKNQEEIFILAKDLVEKVFKDQEYKIISEFKGQELVGKKYKPLFDYFLDKDIEYKENLYTIVSADFVSTTDGVGVVHIAPAFGEEDMALGSEKNLPLIQHVDETGRIKSDIGDGFAGLEVKPKEDTQKTDVEIIKYLSNKELLFSKEKYEHSYPHCWRCDTPLLNYATSSWFVKVTAIKKDLIKNNSQVNWVPEHLKFGRFGHWLEDARDWAISRSRFWGTPLPVWRCSDCGEIKVIGSIEELDKSKIDEINVYAMRHGESEKNILNVFSNDKDKYPLTEKGVKQAKQAAKKLKDLNIYLIISSEVLRSKQTAEIMADELKIKLAFDDRLNEVDPGELQGQSDSDETAAELLKEWQRKSTFQFPQGESSAQVEARMFSLWKEINKNHAGKNVLLVSHGDNIRILAGKLAGLKPANIFDSPMLENTDTVKLAEKTVDIHKDVVDSILLPCPKCSSPMKRIPEVLDCWFESGSMPYAQLHYPFENKDKFQKTFPADFIAEGVDQTRGWFYTLMILATALFDKPAFLNVVANGIVLAEDGTKMSKRLKNYPEPDLIIEKYGADALRFYLLSSPVMSAENFNFSETGVKEAFQKVVMLTSNIVKFYQLYADDSIVPADNSKNILDKWLIAKFNKLAHDVTKELDSYQLSKAVRPIQYFVDEFSTWWLRRSRDRFKSGDEKDKKQALSTFNFVLIEMSKIMAPFMPFLSESVYLAAKGKLESVHLDKWPKAEKADHKIIEQMDSVRKIVEMGLAARAEKAIKIRQPLAQLKVTGYDLPKELAELIADEVNVKEVEFKKGAEIKVELDTELTEELKAEGLLRELVRTINSLRKDNGLTIGDKIKVLWQSDSQMVINILTDKRWLEELKQATLTTEFIKSDNEGAQSKINNEEIKIQLEKI
ncbi:MAG: class I tRNA ligase family protein [Candidatus Buchananbacteria bacterium]|nr:class I tRNA ligase family protein [Candidatus Buchananbacteria bacterium]